MKFIESIGEWNIYKLGGIRVEYTGRPDEVIAYYVAFCNGYFPLEAKTLEAIKVKILDGMKIRKEI